mmetsp:Transcript_16152/g.34924  ORF Transcript_16152/g.34924 Transcript_16152/m.34924 type:complete len:230 (+) Transcript_16152:1366-2055(+)
MIQTNFALMYKILKEVWNQYEDTSLTYLGNLTGLIHEVRVEMFAASSLGIWECKEQIPVVVVQIGYWPQDNNGRAQRVREAQAKYTAIDPRAELVKLDDLSRFYHFDAPSFLIGGNRIARAYQAVMQASVSCPQTSAPTYSPTNSPTTLYQFCAQLKQNQCSGDCSWIKDGPNSRCGTTSSNPPPGPTPPTGGPPSGCGDCARFTNNKDCNACDPICSWSGKNKACSIA